MGKLELYEYDFPILSMTPDKMIYIAWMIEVSRRLTESILIYCQFDPWEYILLKFEFKYESFLSLCKIFA